MDDNTIVAQRVYSNKPGVANYYEWSSGTYDEFGYFVTMVPHTITIKVCEGSNIFGVTIQEAGFIGNVGEVKDNHYALVATTGTVKVRCESDVEEGDYVISNAYGVATKTLEGGGYFVAALTEEFGVEYAVISLDIAACVTDALNRDVKDLYAKINTAESNIISAINVANQAYNKATEVSISNQDTVVKVDDALSTVDKVTEKVEDLEADVLNSTLTSTQAKAIADAAVVSAASMKQEAVDKANEVAVQVKDLTTTLEPLTTWTDPETGSSGASYLANYINNGLATKTEIESVEEDLEHSFTAIQKNAKSLQTLVVAIDKYSVGEYSTAYGLTLEQATSILEPGIIYVPTVSHSETYGEYEREFTQGYLYQWGKLPNGKYGWITIDKFYDEINDINTSAPAVYFSNREIAVAVNDDFGYWYTNTDVIYDISGNVTEEYEPYTLYKWEDNRWLAVATLKGNVNNRAMSQIRQTSNEIALEVTNARESAAALDARITDTEAEVQSIAAWTKDPEGNQYNLAAIKQTADDAGASITQVVESVGEDGKVSAASIVAAVNNDTSGVTISADHINLKGQVTFSDLDEETQRIIELDTLDVQIWSSRGNIFKSRDVTTILTCHVFSAGVEITDTLPNSAFTWEKINNDGTVDTEWRATPYGNHVNAIQITSADVYSRAVFNCAVEI